MTLLAIDPGRAVKPSIGWAVFSDSGELIEKGEATWDVLFSPSKKYGPGQPFPNGLYVSLMQGMYDEVVIEDFINDPKSARGGQRNGTSECIGAVEVLCLISDIPITRQPSSILGAAKLLADYQGTLQHLPHQDSAYLHGYYYLVGKGVLQSKGLSSTL